MMVAQALVGRESDCDRFVPAVHRNQVDVEIDEQVRLGGAPREPYLLAMIGLAERHQLGTIFAVEVVKPFGPELLEGALADNPPNLVLGHPPMERSRDDDVNVVDAVVGQRLQERVEQTLANIRDRKSTRLNSSH